MFLADDGRDGGHKYAFGDYDVRRGEVRPDFPQQQCPRSMEGSTKCTTFGKACHEYDEENDQFQA